MNVVGGISWAGPWAEWKGEPSNKHACMNSLPSALDHDYNIASCFRPLQILTSLQMMVCNLDLGVKQTLSLKLLWSGYFYHSTWEKKGRQTFSDVILPPSHLDAISEVLMWLSAH